jgi:hypothetical protein
LCERLSLFGEYASSFVFRCRLKRPPISDNILVFGPHQRCYVPSVSGISEAPANVTVYGSFGLGALCACSNKLKAKWRSGIAVERMKMKRRIVLLLVLVGLVFSGTGCIVPVPGDGGHWHHGWDRGHRDWH